MYNEQDTIISEEEELELMLKELVLDFLKNKEQETIDIDSWE